MSETLAGVSSSNAEKLLEVPSLAESSVASREVPDPGDLLDAVEAAHPRELSAPSAEELAITRQLVRSARACGVADWSDRVAAGADEDGDRPRWTRR